MSAPVPADLEAHHALWMAALELYVDDARDFLARGPDKPGYRLEAYADLINCGPILCRLCRFTALDPEFVRERFLSSLGDSSLAA
jgi:hypothetical protein